MSANVETTASKISASKLAAAEMDARLAITGRVGSLLEELIEDGRISQSEIACRLGVTRSRVSAILNGPGNWTLDTVGRLLATVGHKIGSIVLVPTGMPSSRNYRHPWLEDFSPTTINKPYYSSSIPEQFVSSFSLIKVEK